MKSSVLVLIAGLFLFLVWRALKQLGFGSWTVLRQTTGLRRGPRDRDMPQIARWHDLLGGEPSDQVDDRTWADLEMDAVFGVVDQTESRIGQQALYARLRRAVESARSVAHFETRIREVHADEANVAKIRRLLGRLDDPRALQMVALLDDLGTRPRVWWIAPLLTAGAL